MNQEQLDVVEEFAFYESGLSSHGCLENLGPFEKEAIQKYGRILLEKQKILFKEGFEGCCYCCEPVGELNLELEKVAKKLYGVVLHLQEVARTSAVVVVGSGLYAAAVEAKNEYEKLIKS